MPHHIRIFHCDDSSAFTRLVRHWLDDHADIRHVGEAHSGDDAIAAIGPARPDVVLLDTMGSPGDTTLLRRIRSEVPQARVIVYSGYVSLLDEGLGEEADAYIEKAEDEEALVAMIRAVAAARATGG
ncbi:MAG TPA: response regulator [Solirubrobacteraceae bacterium]|nr:response regulator [Solirubrobacteraceae bacterium]